MNMQECACLRVCASLGGGGVGGTVFLGLAHSLGLSDLVFVNGCYPSPRDNVHIDTFSVD